MAQQRHIAKLRSLGLSQDDYEGLLIQLLPRVIETETMVHDGLLGLDFTVASETFHTSFLHPFPVTVYRHSDYPFEVETQMPYEHVGITVRSIKDPTKVYYEAQLQHTGHTSYLFPWLRDFMKKQDFHAHPESASITTTRYQDLCTWLQDRGWIKTSPIFNRHVVFRWGDFDTLCVEDRLFHLLVVHAPLNTIHDRQRFVVYTDAQYETMETRLREMTPLEPNTFRSHGNEF